MGYGDLKYFRSRTGRIKFNMDITRHMPSALFIRETNSYIHIKYTGQPPTCIRCGSLQHRIRYCKERKPTESITIDIDIENDSEHGSSEEESNVDTESENGDESEYCSVYGGSGQFVPIHDPSDVQLDEHRQPSNHAINPEPGQMPQEVTTVVAEIAEVL